MTHTIHSIRPTSLSQLALVSVNLLPRLEQQLILVRQILLLVNLQAPVIKLKAKKLRTTAVSLHQEVAASSKAIRHPPIATHVTAARMIHTSSPQRTTITTIRQHQRPDKREVHHTEAIRTSHSYVLLKEPVVITTIRNRASIEMSQPINHLV